MSELFRRFIFFMYIVESEVSVSSVLKRVIGHEPKPVSSAYHDQRDILRVRLLLSSISFSAFQLAIYLEVLSPKLYIHLLPSPPS